jgi:hypothetical protein
MLTAPFMFTRRDEINEYAMTKGISFSDAVVELVNHALSSGALTALQRRPR